MHTKPSPYLWPEKIQKIWQEELEFPLFRVPEINLSEISKTLSKTLEKKVHISISSSYWNSDKEILKEKGKILAFHIAPLSCYMYFAIEKEDIDKAFFAFFSEKSLFPVMKEGFCDFLFLEAMDSISKLKPFNHFSFEQREKKLEEKKLFTIVLEIQIEQTHFFVELILPAETQAKINKHFATHSSFLAPLIASNVSAICRLVGGSVQLSYGEIQRIKKGDFIVMDKSFFDPHTEKGRLCLHVEKTPLFYVSLKQEKIKICDFAQYEDKDMPESNPMEEFEKLMKQRKNPPQAPKEMEEVKSEMPEDEENIISQEDLHKEEAIFTALSSVPITLHVEFARFSMTLEKLMNLQPGNLLELPVHTQEGVDITIQGKKIAKGELVRLGDLLGIRVLEINK